MNPFDSRGYLLDYLGQFPAGERITKMEMTVPMAIPHDLMELAKKHGIVHVDTIVLPGPDHPFWDELDES